MGTQPADDPASTQLNERIGTSNRPADDRLIQNLGRALVILGPIAGGRHQCFGFAGNSAAVPVGDGDIARVPQAAEACDTTRQSVRQVPGGHQVLDGVDRADRNIVSHSRQGIDFRPEVDWIPQFTLGNLPQPVIVLTQDKR